MKTNTPLLILASLCLFITACTVVNDPTPPGATVKLVLAPVNNPYETNIGIYNGADFSNHTSIEEPLAEWTIGGIRVTLRNLLKFDVASLPAADSILSAHLYMYSDTLPQNGDLVHANYGKDNTVLIQQVTSPWDPKTVTWFNQPNAATGNQIIVPHTDQPFKNIDVDVKDMIKSMAASGSNYGFKLSLRADSIYNSRIFCSSYYSDTARRPKLIITYRKASK